MKIEIISGSPRRKSSTFRVALALQSILRKRTDHEIGLIDMKENDIPDVQNVFPSLEQTPEQYKPLAKGVFLEEGFF